MEKIKVVALCSGGFDSVVMLNDLARNHLYDVYVLFFDYGQNNLQQEEHWAGYWCEKLGVQNGEIKLPNFVWAKSTLTDSKVEDYTDLKAQYVPMRNMIFASYALSFAESIGAKQIFMALLGGGTYPDTTEDFLYSLNEIAGDVGISFVAPFIKHDKTYLISRALEYGLVDVGEFGLPEVKFFSCNTPVNGQPCGKCPDCIAIKEMFF